MHRNCEHIITDGNRSIFIDLNYKEEILSFINQNEKRISKFKKITANILENNRIPDLYDKEDINKDCKNLTAMKFKGKGDNFRIYCKEYKNEDKTFVVVMCRLHQKKVQKISKKESSILNAIAKYEYVFN